MPSLDEGSFLLMPTSMPHTGVEQNVDYIKMLDKRLESIPEVEVAVGKWGRVNSAWIRHRYRCLKTPSIINLNMNLTSMDIAYGLKPRKDGNFLLSTVRYLVPEKDRPERPGYKACSSRTIMVITSVSGGPK